MTGSAPTGRRARAAANGHANPGIGADEPLDHFGGYGLLAACSEGFVLLAALPMLLDWPELHAGPGAPVPP
jgi:hypothetical protein